jgi:hypothetical protein
MRISEHVNSPGKPRGVVAPSPPLPCTDRGSVFIPHFLSTGSA